MRPDDLPRPTAEQLAAAVGLLSRTAATPGPEGWVHHAPEDGLLVRSHLDASGRPERQELHVLGEAFLWERGQGVQTAHSVWTPGALPQVQPDPRPLADRLALAAHALAGYTGTDPLLLHLRTALVEASARQPRGATSTSYYPREGLVYGVLFVLFAIAFVAALVYFLGGLRD
jgi:hypothetical protein